MTRSRAWPQWPTKSFTAVSVVGKEISPLWWSDATNSQAVMAIMPNAPRVIIDFI
jgi:hypothetical protein